MLDLLIIFFVWIGIGIEFIKGCDIHPTRLTSSFWPVQSFAYSSNRPWISLTHLWIPTHYLIIKVSHLTVVILVFSFLVFDEVVYWPLNFVIDSVQRIYIWFVLLFLNMNTIIAGSFNRWFLSLSNLSLLNPAERIFHQWISPSRTLSTWNVILSTSRLDIAPGWKSISKLRRIEVFCCIMHILVPPCFLSIVYNLISSSSSTSSCLISKLLILFFFFIYYCHTIKIVLC